ncbi:MAG: hypothetical protein RLZZ324_536, partial [Candidatus Parcubacteria bacterium]
MKNIVVCAAALAVSAMIGCGVTGTGDDSAEDVPMIVAGSGAAGSAPKTHDAAGGPAAGASAAGAGGDTATADSGGSGGDAAPVTDAGSGGSVSVAGAGGSAPAGGAGGSGGAKAVAGSGGASGAGTGGSGGSAAGSGSGGAGGSVAAGSGGSSAGAGGSGGTAAPAVPHMVNMSVTDNPEAGTISAWVWTEVATHDIVVVHNPYVSPIETITEEPD